LNEPEVSPLLEIADQIGGTFTRSELEYQCEQRNIEFDEEEYDSLVDQGLLDIREEREDPEEETIDVEGWSGVPPRRDRRHDKFTDEIILSRIRLYEEITGAPPTKRDWTAAKLISDSKRLRERSEANIEKLLLYQAGDWPSETTVRERFGSLNAALVMAGYDPRATGRQPKAQRPLRNMVAGDEGLDRLFERVEELRAAERGAALRHALYDLAHAAIAEADRLA
jgi:hypothetical protein